MFEYKDLSAAVWHKKLIKLLFEGEVLCTY